jgi:uncharacterized protein (TIGR02391 family)
MAKVRTSELPRFTPGQLEAICRVLGDTQGGLTGSEIGQILSQCNIKDTDPQNTKWKRLYNAFAERLNKDGHSNAVLNFITHALEPVRYGGQSGVFEDRRSGLNVTLAFAGLEYTAEGKFRKVKKASTLPEAERRALRLRQDLEMRGVHEDVLAFCRAELVADNYFHAVLEATKSVAAKVRKRSGLQGDGAGLVDAAFGGSDPKVRINSLKSDSHWSEQKGFANLLKGLFGTFRNPTAHEARTEWPMPEEDALDLLSIASYAHRRIDAASLK